MFSDHDETSTWIAAVSAPSVACSMLTSQQQKKQMERVAAVVIVTGISGNNSACLFQRLSVLIQ